MSDFDLETVLDLMGELSGRRNQCPSCTARRRRDQATRARAMSDAKPGDERYRRMAEILEQLATNAEKRAGLV